MLKFSSRPFDDREMHGQLAQRSPTTSGLEFADFLSQVIRNFLDGLLSTPWLAGLFALIVLKGVVRAVRAVIHGGHRPDPLRRFSRSDRAEILSRAGHRCEQSAWLFGRCRETAGLQADHIHPHSRGGATAVENGQALCPRHNKLKSARVPWDWQLARLARRREEYFPAGTSGSVVRFRSSRDARVRVMGDSQATAPT
jgi:hypothetical protein